MQNADRSALFDRIYEAHHAAVYAYLLGRTNQASTAMDLLQETFLKVWKHINKVPDMDEDQVRFWLFRIAKNVVIGHYRQQQRRKDAAEALEEREVVARRASVDPSETYMTKEAVRAVDAAIRELPEELRLPLVMQVLGGMTSAQIGEILGRPAGTIRYQISRARKRLEEALRSEQIVTEAHP